MENSDDININLLLNRVKNELTEFVQQQTATLKRDKNDEPTKAAKASTSKQAKASEEQEFNWDALSTDNTPVIPLQLLERVDEAEKDALSIHTATRTIDENLQKMQVDLKETYELFCAIGNKFESISFANLKERIKNLNLGIPKNPEEAAQRAELREIFEKNFSENRLNEASNEVGEQLRKLPTEFGGIPEVSAFFSACNQLQRGLEKLHKQRYETINLRETLERATIETYKRIDGFRAEHEKTK